jgi:hypothetical protein
MKIAVSILLFFATTLLAAVHYIRTAATNENNFQVEVTTTTSPQNFICSFVSPSTLHVEWGDVTTNDFTSSITNTHSYAAAGVYTIKMSGHVHAIDFYQYPGLGTPLLITAIKTPIWGINGMTTAVEMFKGCHNLTYFPANLFDYCPDITSFYDTFLECINVTSYSTHLFGHQANITSFYAVFDQNEKLTNIESTVFSGRTNVTVASWAFAKCYDLKSIPSGLYDSFTKNTSFEYVHYRNYDVTNLPPMLFNTCTNVTTYAYGFYQCTNLLGHTPTNAAGLKLWELTPEPTGTSCFYQCTNLSDYGDIPADWK